MSKIVDRLFLFIYSFAIGTIAIAVILAASGFISQPIRLTEPFWLQSTVIATAAVLFLLSIRFSMCRFAEACGAAFDRSADRDWRYQNLD